MNEFVFKDKKKLRCGYTTGTCAALAAKAAVAFLATGSWPTEVRILTPKGTEVKAGIEECRYSEGVSECAVRKDSGDDPDVTDGLLIFARAEFTENGKEDVIIEGGKGVGRVTKPGLDQPVGAPAINSVPRQMIRTAVTEILEECGRTEQVTITISVPKGEEAAERTFNPRLGIVGGISILGTSGVVEPMSEEALVDTIRAHIQVLRAEGRHFLVSVPGNMGAGFLKGLLGDHPTVPLLICSNYIGKTIDMAGEAGASGIVFAGHLGKLVKLGNGIMNTHSREGDGRIDTLISCALAAGADIICLKKLSQANTTEEALEILEKHEMKTPTIGILCDRIDDHMKHRAADLLKTGVILFDAKGEVLGMSGDALVILESAAEEDYRVLGGSLCLQKY